jgi:predicted nucleic acid-binding protein
MAARLKVFSGLLQSAEGRSDLEIDQEIADRWGHLSGARGATVPVTDGLLAATAIHHSLKLVTRNTKGHDANRRRTFQSLAD